MATGLWDPVLSLSASSLYSLHFAPPTPNYPCIHPYSHTLWNRSSALHSNERGANPIFNSIHI